VIDSLTFVSTGNQIFLTFSTKGVDMEAYCVKCKAKKEMKDGEKVTMKNGRNAMKGKCPDCGTTLFRIQK
jgi:NAD-dependent SIR2 family protein deacetylase